MITQNNGLAPYWMQLDDAVKEVIRERDILLEFVRKVHRSSCNIIPEQCLPCDALDLLRKIGKVSG